MNSMIYLIPLAVAICAVGLAAFFWTVKLKNTVNQCKVNKSQIQGQTLAKSLSPGLSP